MDRTEVIYEFLKKATEPMKISQLAEASGLDAHDVDKAIKKLKEEGKVTSPKRCYWSVTE